MNGDFFPHLKCHVKENSTDFTHESLLTGFREYYCICNKGFIKVFSGSIESCATSGT